MNSTAATRSSSFYLLWLLPLLAFFINTFLPQLAYGQTIPMFVPQFGNYTLSSSNNLYCSDMFISSITITEGQSVVPGGGSEINCALACDEAKDRCAGFDVLKGTGKTQCNFYSKSSCDNLSSQLTSTGWILSAAYYSRTKPYVTGQIFPGIGRTVVAGSLGSPGAAVNLSFQDFVGFDMSASSCQNVTYTVVPAVGYDAHLQPIVYALPQGLAVSNNSVQGTLPPNPFAIGFVAQCADGTTATSIMASPPTYGAGSAGVPLASYTGTTPGTTGTTAGTTPGTTGTTAGTTSGTTGTTAGTTSGTTGTTAGTTSGTTGTTAGT
ncbi:MAG: hypothetical protein KBD64_05270, partial [Gammaproteobacteria bacterium]|nr:hypothetical protein [Gammaproteobacteria bacterium]